MSLANFDMNQIRIENPCDSFHFWCTETPLILIDLLGIGDNRNQLLHL